MHTVLLLSSVLLVVLGGFLVLGLLRRLAGWRRRRRLQLAVLAAPLVSLALGAGGLYHFTGRACFLGAPRWDSLLAVALPLAMGLTALGALTLGLARGVLLRRIVARRGLPAPPEVEALLARLAADLGAPRPRALLCLYDRPLALVCGLRRPTVLVSTWMLERLDRRELEAVLAHELAHVARRDYPVVWLATTLRDAFWYLPTGWAAHRLLQAEKELACDDLAARTTARPLALASALAKVWQEASGGGPAFAGAQSLVGAGESLEGRIERLLAPPAPPLRAARWPSPAGRFGGAAVVVTGLLFFQAVNLVVALAPMGCGPATALGRLF